MGQCASDQAVPAVRAVAVGEQFLLHLGERLRCHPVADPAQFLVAQRDGQPFRRLGMAAVSSGGRRRR